MERIMSIRFSLYITILLCEYFRGCAAAACHTTTSNEEFIPLIVGVFPWPVSEDPADYRRLITSRKIKMRMQLLLREVRQWAHGSS